MNIRRVTIRAVLLAVAVAATGCSQPPSATGQSMVTAVRSASWDGKTTSGVALTSEHYRIYTTVSNSLLLKYLPGFMEAAYGNYLRLSGLADQPLGEKMPIYMMASRKEWAALTRMVTGPLADVYLSIQAGGYCYKKVCVFWNMGGIGTLSVSAHEGLHQFLTYRMRNRLPMWLEEGLCTSAEGYLLSGEMVEFTPQRNDARFTSLRDAIVQGNWIPLSRLLSMDAGDAIHGKTTRQAVGYYGQLWALSCFLQTHPAYVQGFKRILADAEAGQFHVALAVPPAAVRQLQLRGRIYNRTVSEPLFRYYIHDDLAAFEKEFHTFAMRLVKLDR